MLSSLASLLDSFRIPNRRHRGFDTIDRRHIEDKPIQPLPSAFTGVYAKETPH